MCILEGKNITLDDVMTDLMQRLNSNERNIKRVKKLYHNEDTFDDLMNRIIEKDSKRFEKFISSVVNNKKTRYPTPWLLFSTLLDIVQIEGEEEVPRQIKIPIPSNKEITRRNIKYMGWTFHWIHKKGTVLSIYNRYDDLIYIF